MPAGRRNPFAEIEQLLERLGAELDTDSWRTGPSVAVDVADHGDEFVVTADLPGFEKADIEVTLIDSTLRIEAERETTDAVEAETYLRRERHQRSVSRSVQLPDAIDESAISATHTNGVLEVRLPKRDAEDGGQRIDIK